MARIGRHHLRTGADGVFVEIAAAANRAALPAERCMTAGSPRSGRGWGPSGRQGVKAQRSDNLGKP